MEIARETLGQHTPADVQDDARSEPSFVEALIDPVNLFDHPRQVAEHPLFTREEKRTILLSWARDELAAEQVASRLAPELRTGSRIDAVLDALAAFDQGAAAEYISAIASIRAQWVRRRHGPRGYRHEAISNRVQLAPSAGSAGHAMGSFR